MKDFELMGTLVTAPSAAFAELRERPRFWLPLLLIIAAFMAFNVAYFSVVDVPWLADQTVGMNPRFASLPPETREKILAAMTATSMSISTLALGLIVMLTLFAVLSLYYWVAGKVVGIVLSFKHWFTMTCWTALPTLIGIIASAAVLFTETPPLQLRQDQLQILSLNELFFHVQPGEKGMYFLSVASIVTPLNWALTIVCVRTWSTRSWASSATFALLPSVVAYSVIAYFSFR